MKFRELWLEQYLPQLQERQLWRTKESNLKVRDLVLLETENKKQVQWPVAGVNKIMRGKDVSCAQSLFAQKPAMIYCEGVSMKFFISNPEASNCQYNNRGGQSIAITVQVQKSP